MCSVTDWALLQTFEARRRDLFIQQRYPIALGQGLCLLEDSSQANPAFSLQDILSLSGGCEAIEGERATLQLLHRARRIVEGRIREVNLADGDVSAAESVSEGLRLAYRDCAAAVPADMLRKRFLHSAVSRAHDRAVRRSFASQYGVYLALQLLLDSSSSLAPKCLYIRPSEGAVFLRAVKSSITFSREQTQDTPKKAIILRVTRCIQAAMGELLLLGPCAAAIGCTLDSFMSQDSILEVGYCVILPFT